MSSCVQPVPYQFQAGGVCAGHGICVNSTRTLGLLCKCDSGYSGASDFFDNRVEQLPDGSWLSYSCNASDIGTYVIWSFFVLIGIIRTVQLIPLWVNFYQKHYVDKKLKEKSLWRDAPFRIVTIDLFGVGIPLFVCGCAKLAGNTFGTDILATVAMALTIIFFNVVSYYLAKLEFDIFVQGSSNPKEAEKAKRLRLFLKALGEVGYFLFNCIPTMWALSTVKSEGPLADGGNAEELAIYFRNIGGLAMGIGEVASTCMIRKRVRMLKLVSKDDDNAVAYIIKKMEIEMKSYIFRMCGLSTIYGLWSIPYLLPYQTYMIGIIIGLGLVIPHSKAFTTEKEKRARTQTTVGPSSTELSKRATIDRSKRITIDSGKQDSVEQPGSSVGTHSVKRDSVPSVGVSPAQDSSVSRDPVEPVTAGTEEVSILAPTEVRQNLLEGTPSDAGS